MRTINLLILAACATLLLVSISRWIGRSSVEFIKSGISSNEMASMEMSTDSEINPSEENSSQWQYLVSDSLSEDPRFANIADQLSAKIQSYNNDANSNGKTYRWLNIAVTILTAGSTCVSAIHASRKEPAESRLSRIYLTVCAVLTLISSVTNTLASSFNEDKTEAAKQASYWMNKRSQFFTDYDGAKPDERIIILRKYSRELT